jgi:hypothetical protein
MTLKWSCIPKAEINVEKTVNDARPSNQNRKETQKYGTIKATI